VETLHIRKPPQGFAFGIRKEFGPPRRPLGPLARNILGGIAVARLGAPEDSRAIYLPTGLGEFGDGRGTMGDGGDGHWNDGLRGTMGTGTTDCDLRWREHGLRSGTVREIFWPDGAWEKISGKDLMRMQNGWRSSLWELCKLICNFANPLKCKVENGKPLEMLLMDLCQFRIRNGHLDPQETGKQIRIHNMTVVLFLYKSLKKSS